MRRFAILLSVGLLLAFAFLPAAFAQESGAMLPAVVTLAADLPAIAIADAEAGMTPVTLSWTTVNVQPGQALALDAYVLHEWTSLLNAGDVLEPTGQRTLMVEHPLNFGAPTYRLSILDADGVTLDQRVLSIPYLDAGDVLPTVESFTSAATEVTPGENGVALVPVAWQIANRLPGSYLAFDQILADGQIVSVDLPRVSLWVASSGEGAVAPTVPAGAATVTLVLRVVDAGTGQTYDSAELTLPMAGSATPAPVETLPPTTPSEAGIFYFQPTLIGAAADGQFALVWDVSDAPAVQVEYVDVAGNPVVRSGLKPAGDLAVPLAEVGFAPEPGRYQFTLTVTDANGAPLSDPSGAPIAQTVEIPAETTMTISSFSSDATVVTPGQPIGLSWDVTGATNIVLARLSIQSGSQLFSQVVGEALPAAGSLQFTMPPIAETGFFGDQVTFLLTAEDGTSANRVAYLRLPIAEPSVTVNSFTLSRSSATIGDTVTLTWETTGATGVDIRLRSGGEQPPLVLAEGQPPTGSFDYTFPADITPTDGAGLVTFVLDVHGEDGTVRDAENNVMFSTEGLSIVSFTAEPAETSPGGAVSLAWEVTGATRVWLSQANPETGVMATIADNLPLAGSLQIAVPSEIAAEQLPLTTGFVLRAQGTGEDVHNQDALITIVAP